MRVAIAVLSVVAVALVLLLLLAANGASASAGASPFKPGKSGSFILYMDENRAFFELVGWLKRLNPEIRGLTGKEFETYNGKRYYVNDTAEYVAPVDPGHDFDQQIREMFGVEWDKLPKEAYNKPAPMTGYVAYEADKTGGRASEKDLLSIVDAFAPEKIPAFAQSALKGALFDAWHVATPANTITNRVFTHATCPRNVLSNGTTQYLITTGKDDIHLIRGYAGETIYEYLQKQMNLTFAIYYHDISDVLYTTWGRKFKNMIALKDAKDFEKDAKEGKLANVVWISPRFYHDFGKPAGDMHPSHSVAVANDEFAKLYKIVRASPQWDAGEITLQFFLDEGGGFYDAYPPPFQGRVPAPYPGHCATDVSPPFCYDMLGQRTATWVISPWVQPQVIHEAPLYPKSGGHAFTLDSMFKTIVELYGGELGKTVPAMSARQAWAASFTFLYNFSAPMRADWPMELPTAPQSKEDRARDEARMMKNKPNGLHREFYRIVETLHGRDSLDIDRFDYEGGEVDMGRYVEAQFKLAQEKAREALAAQEEKEILKGLNGKK